MALNFVVPGRLIPVSEQNDLEQVRRSARQVGDGASLDAPDLSDLAEAVTGMATRLLASGAGGYVSVRDLGTVGGPGVEAVSFARRDGVVGGDSPSWGRFPASPDDATAYVTGLVATGVGGGAHGWRAWRGPAGVGILVCAVGGSAAQAPQLLERALSVPVVAGPNTILRVLHGVLSGTPGAAAAAVELDLVGGTARAASIGDIGVSVVADGVRTAPPTRAGVVGVGSRSPGRRADEVAVRWSRELSVVVHTAGIDPAGPARAPEGSPEHPAFLCARLMQDHRTAGGDACVVAARVGRA